MLSRRFIGIFLFLFLITANLHAEEKTIFITYGSDASITEGDDDFQQVIFFALPETITDTLYLRIFDADVGGRLDARYGEFDSQTRFRFYGGSGAYTARSIRTAFPSAEDLNRGTLVHGETFGEDPFRDSKWYTFASFAVNEGEKVQSKRIFKLVVEGLSGNDGNTFEVAVSTRSKRNKSPKGVKIFTYCPTIRLPEKGLHAELRFFVPKSVREIVVHNFDLAAAVVGIDTKFRSGLPITPSAQGQWAEDNVELLENEVGQNVALTFHGGYEIPNDASFYFTTAEGMTLPIEMPIKIFKPNHRPVPRFKLTPLSDCGTIVFDASRSTDEDGHELTFSWDFGDGEKGRGSRVVHQYAEAGTYSAELVVTDKSGHVGNSSLKQFNVLVNEPPVAVPGDDQVTVPGAKVHFDGSESYDTDGKIRRYVWEFGDGTRAEGAETTHTYNKPGNFNVTLRVEDDSNSPCNFGTGEMEVWVNARPVVDIGKDHIISPNQPITLSGERSYDSDGEISKYIWDFGDGSTASEMIATHAYPKPGRYQVKLTVIDDTDVGNNTASDMITVIVNDPPEAIAASDLDQVATGEKIVFNGYQSSDRDGKLIEYLWDFGDGGNDSGIKVKHAYAYPGVYTVRLTVRDNSTTDSDTDYDEIEIIVNHPPVADAGADQWVSSSIVQFDGRGSTDLDNEIIKYSWDFGDGTTAEGIAPLHVYSNPGTYLVTLTITDASGTSTATDSSTMQVIINYSPIADAGQPLIGSPGEMLEFDGSMSIDPDGEINRFVWDFGDGERAEGMIVQHRYNNPGLYNVSLTVFDNSQHEKAHSYDGTTVFINTPPVADAGQDILAAPGDKIKFRGSNSYDPDGKIVTYQWDFSDGVTETGKPDYTRVFETPGIYSATLTVVDNSSANNAQNQDQCIIRINHQPLADPGSDLNTCQLAVTFNGDNSVDADGDPLTYSWDFGDGSPVKSGVTVKHTYGEPGTYPVILTVDDGTNLRNSRHSASMTVWINQAPIASAGENRTVCAGDVVLFSAASSIDPEGGLMRFEWDFGDGTTDIGINPTKKYTKGGVYEVTLTVEDDSGLPCNTSIDRIIVRVAESPVADAGEDQTICANTEIHFDGTKSTDFDGLVNRFFWDFGDGITKDGPTPAHVFRDPGEYIVTLTITGDQVGECDNTATDELIVTVYDAPIAVFSSPESIPVNSEIELDASESKGGGAEIITYDWDFGDQTTGSGKTVSHVYQNPGKYFISLNIVTDSKTSCNETSIKDLIIVNDAPEAVAGEDQLVGVNQITTFNGSASNDSDGSIASYSWDFGDGASAKGVQVRHKYEAPGVYPVILTIQDDTELSNSTDSDTLTVTVNAAPEPVITAPEWVCAGVEFELNGKKSKDPDGKRARFSWNMGDGSTKKGSLITHSYSQPGAYNVTLILDDGQNVSNSVVETSKTIRVNHPPVVNAGAKQVVCPGETVNFDASESYDLDGSIISFEWDFNDGGTVEGEKVAHQFDEPGRYNVQLTAYDDSDTDCGIVQDYVEIIVNSSPVAVAGEDQQAFTGGAHDDVFFDGTGSHDPDGDPLTFMWDFGDGSNAEGPVVSHTYKAPGKYTVTLLVKDSSGLSCGKAVDRLLVTVVRH